MQRKFQIGDKVRILNGQGIFKNARGVITKTIHYRAYMHMTWTVRVEVSNDQWFYCMEEDLELIENGLQKLSRLLK